MPRGSVLTSGFTVVACLVAALHVAAAPPAAAPKDGESSTAKVTIYHWWISPSENAALGALVQKFQEKYPGVKVYAEPMGRGGVRWGYPILKQLVVDKRPLE